MNPGNVLLNGEGTYRLRPENKPVLNPTNLMRIPFISESHRSTFQESFLLYYTDRAKETQASTHKYY